MGAVFKAYNPDTQSTVAIKLMHGGAQANDAARQRFQREAASVAGLRTRHVVGLYDFGADVDGTLYLVMEYMQGHALRAEIAPMPNALPLPRVNFIIDQALRGLGAAHRAGIVHRDLKPENLFVADTDDGEVIKVLDFGIARVQRGDTPNLTHSGALMGTPAYMAPEQVAGNRGQVGRHSDVYAMGVILYEMLTGISPFHADTLSEVLSRILSRTFAPLAQVRPDLPFAVSQLVDRALADDPAQRFGSADQLREAWNAAWAQLPGDIRHAPVPLSPLKAAAAASEPAAPGAGFATDVPSAPTSGRIANATPARTGEALAATAAVTPPPPSFDPARSVTPGPVVVENRQPTESARRSKAPLFAVLGLAVVGGGVAAVLLVGGKDKGETPAPQPAVDPSARLDVADAAVVAPTPAVDAAPATAPAPAPAIDVKEGMVRFAGGTFEMGVDPAKYKKIPGVEALHAVTVAPFFLDKTEAAGGDGMPITKVTWTAAKEHCEKAGKRLPTAAEWDLAARSGRLADANLLDKGRGGAEKVGSHPGDCTPDGVCDLLGNVMEWTADDWGKGAPAGSKVVRGASYTVAPTAGWYASIHARLPLAPDTADGEVGFRCAADAAP
jgi:serine/threonine-protein kinase